MIHKPMVATAMVATLAACSSGTYPIRASLAFTGGDDAPTGMFEARTVVAISGWAPQDAETDPYESNDFCAFGSQAKDFSDPLDDFTVCVSPAEMRGAFPQFNDDNCHVGSLSFRVFPRAGGSDFSHYSGERDNTSGECTSWFSVPSGSTCRSVSRSADEAHYACEGTYLTGGEGEDVAEFGFQVDMVVEPL